MKAHDVTVRLRPTEAMKEGAAIFCWTRFEGTGNQFIEITVRELRLEQNRWLESSSYSLLYLIQNNTKLLRLQFYKLNYDNRYAILYTNLVYMQYVDFFGAIIVRIHEMSMNLKVQIQ